MGKSIEDILRQQAAQRQAQQAAQQNQERSINEQRERSRQDWRNRMRMFEAAAGPAAASSAAAGAGGTNKRNFGWAAVFGLDTIKNDNVEPQSVTADTDGNVYTLSKVTDNSSPVIVRKISADGALVWSSAFINLDATFTPARIRYNGGYLFAIYNDGIQKIDPSDGSEVWGWWADSSASNNSFTSIGFLSDGKIATLSNFISEGDTFLVTLWEEDFEANTITKFSEHELYVFIEAGMDDLYSNADMVVDADDNLILPLNYNPNGGGYGTLVVKWSTADNEPVWQYNIWEDYFDEVDQDCTGLGTDADGNIYVNGYGAGLTKLSPAGELIWARLINKELYGLGVKSDGESYMYGSDGGKLYLVKFSADGDLLWVNGVSSSYSVNNGGWIQDAASMMQVYDDRLYFVATQNTTQNEIIFNTNGNFGKGQCGFLNFTDAIDDITVTGATPLNDAIGLSYYPTDYLVSGTASFVTDLASQELTKITLRG